jgi:hypothetical protein
MSDPVIERIKREVSEEFEVPLVYFTRFLELEEEKVHYARRHGVIEDLKKLTAQTARPDPGASG